MDDELRKRRARAMSLSEEARWDQIHAAQDGPLGQLGFHYEISDWEPIDLFLDDQQRQEEAVWLGLPKSAGWTDIEEYRQDEREILDRYALEIGLQPGADWEQINARMDSLDEATRAEVSRRYHAGEFGVPRYFAKGALGS